MSAACVIGDCGRAVRYVGSMCTMHKKRAARGGNVFASHPLKAASYGGVTCTANGCTEVARALGLCGTHWARNKRNGDPNVRQVQPRGSAWQHGNGYLKVTRKGHPVASLRTGKAYEHRVVLYDAIGAGPHVCHWCDASISWEHRAMSDPQTLVADHVNFIRHDNRPENLVPACVPCNVRRKEPSHV